MKSITLSSGPTSIVVDILQEDVPAKVGAAVTATLEKVWADAKNRDLAPIVQWDLLNVTVEPRFVSDQRLTSAVTVQYANLAVRAEVQAVIL